MAFYERLPCIPEESLYLDQGTEYMYFQSDPSYEEWTDKKIEKSLEDGFTGFWMKLCVENLEEKTRIQKELVNAQIPAESLDVWGTKQFTMHERMFETEEQLQEARKQFQKIASDVNDWAPLEYLRAQRNSALVAVEGLHQRETHSPKRPPRHAVPTPGLKLPPIRNNGGRATVKGRPLYGNLNSASNIPKKEPNLCNSDYKPKEKMPDIFDPKRTSSRLPRRNPDLSAEEFLSTYSPKHLKLNKQSKLPVSVCKYTQSTVNTDATPSANVCQTLRIHGPCKKTDEGLPRTDGGVVLPRLPSPPRSDSKKRTSTNLRRCHFKLSTAVSLKL